MNGDQIFIRAADQLGCCRDDDEERKEREQCQIGKVASVDEPVIIDADNNPSGKFERPGTWPDVAEKSAAVGVQVRMFPPCFRGFGGNVAHEESNTQRRTRIAGISPVFGKFQKCGIIGWQIDDQSH